MKIYQIALVSLLPLLIGACSDTDKEALKEQAKAVAEETKKLGDAAWESTKNAADEAAEKSKEVYEASKEATADAYEATKDKSAELYGEAKEATGEAYEATKETICRSVWGGQGIHRARLRGHHGEGCRGHRRRPAGTARERRPAEAPGVNRTPAIARARPRPGFFVSWPGRYAVAYPGQ